MMKLSRFAAGVFLSGATFAAAQAQDEPAPAIAGTVFGSWRHVCDESGCQAVLTMADNKKGTRVLSWAFVYDRPNDRLSTVVTLPLGVAIPAGLGVLLNDGQGFNWPYQVCDAEGCRAVAVIDSGTEKALTAATSAQIKFVPYGSRGAVAVSAPMDGFKEAKAMLKADGSH